jgi:hypothetical protein
VVDHLETSRREPDGLAELLRHLPTARLHAGERAVLNAFLIAGDDDRLVLVVGHLRLTVPVAAVLDMEPLDPDAQSTPAPMVRATLTLPLTLLDVRESLPEDVVVPAGRPFVTATRPRPPQYHQPAAYREQERAFLDARGIAPAGS